MATIYRDLRGCKAALDLQRVSFHSKSKGKAGTSLEARMAANLPSSTVDRKSFSL